MNFTSLKIYKFKITEAAAITLESQVQNLIKKTAIRRFFILNNQFQFLNFNIQLGITRKKTVAK